MSWMSALWRGAAVVAYFVLATVWLPDFVLGLGAVQDASTALQDLITLVVWGGALAAGMYGLKRGQSRGVL